MSSHSLLEAGFVKRYVDESEYVVHISITRTAAKVIQYA